MRVSVIVVVTALLLGSVFLAGCLYVPGPGEVYGSIDYSVPLSGSCLVPGGVHHGRTVVPAPGSYRRYR